MKGIGSPKSANAFEVLENSGVEISHTGDTEMTPLKTINIPAGKIKANGSLRIELSGTSNGNNDGKSIFVGFNSGALIIDFIGLNAGASEKCWQYSIIVHNCNDESKQSVYWRGWGGTTGIVDLQCGGLIEGTLDTSNPVDIDIMCHLDDAADSIELKNTIVEVFSQS